MSRSRILVFTLLIPLAVLAGCLQGDDGAVPGSGDNEGDDGEPGQGDADDGGNETGPDGNETAGLAVLTGNVTASGADNGTDDGNQSGDGEIVADANLTLVLDEMGGNVSEATTSETGSYRFEGMEPGAYTLQVEAGCCALKNVSVALAAGEQKVVDVQLEPLDEGPAYRLETHAWEGRIVCGLAGVNLCFLHPDNSNLHTFDVDEGLKSAVVAMEWGSGEMSLSFERPFDDDTHEYRRDEGGSPLGFRVDAGEGGDHDFDNIDDSWELRFRVFPQGNEPISDEEFTVHYHLFYDDFAPDDHDPLVAS